MPEQPRRKRNRHRYRFQLPRRHINYQPRYFSRLHRPQVLSNTINVPVVIIRRRRINRLKHFLGKKPQTITHHQIEPVQRIRLRQFSGLHQLIGEIIQRGHCHSHQSTSHHRPVSPAQNVPIISYPLPSSPRYAALPAQTYPNTRAYSS